MTNSINKQTDIFKKDDTILKKHILSVFDVIDLEENKLLNIFTSNPKDYKEAVLASLTNLNVAGKLYGIPMVVKDNFNTTIFPTSAGTPALKEFIAKEDAPIIKKLKEQGVVIVGKTNMHELAFGITSNNAYFGAVKNPINPLYFAGGSSGGTAVAVAKGITAIGMGTDTGGSCRIPAALCGVYGFRPTSGLYNNKHIVPLSSSRDTPGIIANSVENIISVDEAITDTLNEAHIDAKKIRIAIPKAYFYEGLSPSVKKISEETIAKIKNYGIELVEENIEEIPTLLKESINLVLHETSVELKKYLTTDAPTISYENLVSKIASPDVKGLFSSGAIAAHPNYSEALEERKALQQAYENYFEKHQIDAILYPTTPVEAMPIKDSDNTIILNGNEEPTFPTYIKNMNPGSYAGVPGITIPSGVSDKKLPIGMHLEGKAKSDKKLLQIAKLIDSILNP